MTAPRPPIRPLTARRASLSPAEVRRLIRDRAAGFPNIKAAAADAGVSVVHLYDVLGGRKTPGPKVLAWVDIEKVVTVTYRRI
jgi:hypothetical protein